MTDAIMGFELFRLILTANKYLDGKLKPLAKKYGLTLTQIRIIYFTKKLGISTIGTVAKMTGIACTNASSICKKLSHMGFLSRKRNKNDERVVESEVTDEGLSAASESEASVPNHTIVG